MCEQESHQTWLGQSCRALQKLPCCAVKDVFLSSWTHVCLPLQCITDRLRAKGISFSTDLPDDVLHFVRRHPLMAKQILPVGGRPLLFRRSLDYTKIAVLKVTALDGQTYHMIFVGTGVFYSFSLHSVRPVTYSSHCISNAWGDDPNLCALCKTLSTIDIVGCLLSADEGWLQRAVEVKGQLHIIEELQLFEEPQSVDSIVISQKQVSKYSHLDRTREKKGKTSLNFSVLRVPC